MKTDYKKAIGERIREVRQTLHITQREFADTLGLSPGNLSSIETARCNATSSLLYAISQNYDVNVNYILRGIGKMFLSDESSPPKDNRESVDRLETPADLFWFIEHSSMFKHIIMGYAAKFFYQNDELIKRNIEQLKSEKEKND
jgi:transcriptional regulator with XRE-family HTH domain